MYLTTRDSFDRLFDSLLTAATPAPSALRRWMPAMDLVEQDDAFVLKADLPGMGHEDLAIEVEGRVLTIAGERKPDHEQRRDGYVRMERAFGQFRRELTLPEGVDPDAVSASFDRGVLTVTVPKPERARPRRIQIAASDEQRTIEA